jgi:DNA polymerase eta
MSSSQPFEESSQLSFAAVQHPHTRRKSRFTYKHLSQLQTYSTSTPLRVIAHLDLDAFYAQCEMVRLGVPEDQPLAVRQWDGLIAINYPSRKFGLTRHIAPAKALELCPNLIMQHCPTWKEGDEKWEYRNDAFKHIATQKVSLDPYRHASRRILAVIKETLPAAPLQRVEKAGVDEVFMDLSAQVHSVLLERYPELALPPPYDDPSENLPLPPTTALDWDTDHLVDLDVAETEEEEPDWDDLVMLVGSEIVRSVRAAIREELKYTTSAGIAQNKLIAKLGSAYKKPNQQTIVRNRAIQQFLSGHKFTKFRNLGGKLGDHIAETFETEAVEELLKIPLEELRRKIDDDRGGFVYDYIRGVDHSEVNSRTQIKSMLSAKSFRPSINTVEKAIMWLKIFAADIFSRCVEEGVLENKRRPKTITLHHRQGQKSRAKGCSIPSGQIIEQETLFQLAKHLMMQVVEEGWAWPCSNLSLNVGGFEDGISSNMGIGAFLVRGEEARAINTTKRDSHALLTDAQPEKRRKVDNGGIQRFLGKGKESSAEELEDDAEHFGILGPSLEEETSINSGHFMGTADKPSLQQQSIRTFLCERCNSEVAEVKYEEHNDWHFAKNLADADRVTTAVSSSSHTFNVRNKAKPGQGPMKKATASEKGQSKLAFGK